MSARQAPISRRHAITTIGAATVTVALALAPIPTVLATPVPIAVQAEAERRVIAATRDFVRGYAAAYRHGTSSAAVTLALADELVAIRRDLVGRYGAAGDEALESAMDTALAVMETARRAA